MDDHVSVEAAAASAGISARTLRYWIAHGKLPAVAVQRRRLVRLADVERLAALTGRAGGNPSRTTTSAAAIAASDLGSAAATPHPVADHWAVLARIRDEWVQPLVVQIAHQAECIGRLEERAAQAEGRAGAAERELAGERGRRERAEGERDGARRQLRELATARLRERAGGGGRRGAASGD